jgi:hypothetical protein
MCSAVSNQLDNGRIFANKRDQDNHACLMLLICNGMLVQPGNVWLPQPHGWAEINQRHSLLHLRRHALRSEGTWTLMGWLRPVSVRRRASDLPRRFGLTWIPPLFASHFDPSSMCDTLLDPSLIGNIHDYLSSALPCWMLCVPRWHTSTPSNSATF